MEFEIKTPPTPNVEKYRTEDIDAVREFAKQMYREFGNYIKAAIIFGSSVKKLKKLEPGQGDIDVLVIIDDLTIQTSAEVVEAYRVITEKIILKVSKRLHVTTLKFTAFWDYIRNGDPVAVNMLRDGVALFDTNFFMPLQALLRRGRIRPSLEAIYTYYHRAPMTLNNAQWHLLQATIDLYWACIDAAHAALMTKNVLPPSPEHVADMLRETFVSRKLLENEYPQTMEAFYKMMKMITHRQIREIKGEEFDTYYKKAKMFVDKMRSLIDMKV